MAWDPSIILQAKQYVAPDPMETMRSLGQLALQNTQQQHAQASLADLLHQRAQTQALQGIYSANAQTPDALPQALMAGGFGHQSFEAEDQASQQRKALADIMQQYKERTVKLLYGTKDQADYVKRLSVLPPQQQALFPAQWDEAKPLVESLAIPPEKRADLDMQGQKLEEEKRWHQQVGSQKVVDTGTGQRFAYNDATGKFDIPVGQAKPPGGGLGGEGGSGLSKEALEMEAQHYATTGKFSSSIGNGKAAGAAKMAIINRAAELNAGGDLASASAEYKANAASLLKTQQQADFIEQKEGTALKNLDTALGAARKIPDFGSSLLNTPIRHLAEKFGNTDMSAYKSALLTAQTEVSNVLSGATGGAVSDSARHEAQELLRGDATLAQLESAANILKKDMANRQKVVQENIRAIQGRMKFKKPGGTGGSGEGQAATPPGAGGATGPHGPTVTQNGHTYNWNPATGQYE